MRNRCAWPAARLAGGLLMLAGVLVAGGCSPPVSQETRLPQPPVAEPEELAPETKRASRAGRDWCIEHCVPASNCGQCSEELAAEFQHEGDWCEEHGRPDSQCFFCRPQLRAQYAASYREKYGESPPEQRARRSRTGRRRTTVY